MRRASISILAVTLAAFAATARPIAAEPAPPPANEAEPLSMSADKLDLDVEAKTAILTGHVKLARGAMTVGCPRVEVRYDDAGHVKWVKGTGGVDTDVKNGKEEAREGEMDLAASTM